MKNYPFISLNASLALTGGEISGISQQAAPLLTDVVQAKDGKTALKPLAFSRGCDCKDEKR